jgi:hypothetical protein
MNLAIKNNVPNAFNTPRLCMITGEIKPLASSQPTPREHRFYSAKTAAEKLKMALADAPNSFHIPTQTESDRTRSITPRRLVG